jgi:hypothetical protein
MLGSEAGIAACGPVSRVSRADNDQEPERFSSPPSPPRHERHRRLLLTSVGPSQAGHDDVVKGAGMPAVRVMSRTFEFDAYVIEVQGQTAGIVARDGRGYRFHAATHPFNSLDGRNFASPLQAEKAALALVTVPLNRPRNGGQPRPASPLTRNSLTFA